MVGRSCSPQEASSRVRREYHVCGMVRDVMEFSDRARECRLGRRDVRSGVKSQGADCERRERVVRCWSCAIPVVEARAFLSRFRWRRLGAKVVRSRKVRLLSLRSRIVRCGQVWSSCWKEVRLLPSTAC